METKTVILGEPLTVVFPNRRSAQILNVSRDATPEQVLVALGIRPPQAVAVAGGTAVG